LAKEKGNLGKYRLIYPIESNYMQDTRHEYFLEQQLLNNEIADGELHHVKTPPARSNSTQVANLKATNLTNKVEQAT